MNLNITIDEPFYAESNKLASNHLHSIDKADGHKVLDFLFLEHHLT